MGIFIDGLSFAGCCWLVHVRLMFCSLFYLFADVFVYFRLMLVLALGELSGVVSVWRFVVVVWIFMPLLVLLRSVGLVLAWRVLLIMWRCLACWAGVF